MKVLREGVFTFAPGLKPTFTGWIVDTEGFDMDWSNPVHVRVFTRCCLQHIARRCGVELHQAERITTRDELPEFALSIDSEREAAAVIATAMEASMGKGTSRERGEGFRAADAQRARADRLDVRCAELRRELTAEKNHRRLLEQDLAATRADAKESADAVTYMRQNVILLTQRHREVLELSEDPLWRIAARRLAAWWKGLCR